MNLDEAYSQGLEAWSSHTDGVAALCRQIASEPLVPRAYYARTGTLRYAEANPPPPCQTEGYSHLFRRSKT